MKDYSGLTAVITGAASGIGYGIAKACVARNIRVVVADIDPVALESAVSSLGGPCCCTAHLTDVASEPDVRALAECAFRDFSKVDFLFINAGVNVLGYIWEYDLWDWKWILDVNLWGTIHCLTSFLPLMVARNDESFITFTSSAGAFLPFQTAGPYNATKSAILALAETLQNELLITRSKIQLRVACPAMVNTNLDKAETHRQMQYKNPKVDYTSPERQERWIPHRAVEAGASVAEVVQAIFASFDKDQFYVFPQPGVKATIAEKFKLILRDDMPLDLSRSRPRSST